MRARPLAAAVAAAAGAVRIAHHQCASLVTDWGDAKKATALERNYKNREVVQQRREMLALLAPTQGERILDIGCGPGFVMLDMADAVGPSGCVEGVDPSGVMVELARMRLSNAPSSCSVCVGTVEALPFPDASFDAVVLCQVLLYVDDVPLALREARRVLRPHGRLLVCETDWDSLVVNTADKARFERIRQACSSTFVDAHLPPKLPGMLSRVSMPISEVRTVPMVSVGSPDSSGSSFVGNWAFKVVAEKGRAFGLAEEEVRAWLDEQRALAEDQAFFACVHRFLFLAHKQGSIDAPYPGLASHLFCCPPNETPPTVGALE